MTSSRTDRSPLLVIDTCVVLEAHRLGVWRSILNRCAVALPETVIGETIQVAREYDDFEQHLETEARDGLFRQISLSAPDLAIVMRQCPAFPGKIDAGEMECLAYILGDTLEASLVCSSDAVVFRYLGWVQEVERGISLEEVLHQIGSDPRLSPKLSKRFRETWSKKGFAEALQRGFVKP